MMLKYPVLIVVFLVSSISFYGQDTLTLDVPTVKDNSKIMLFAGSRVLRSSDTLLFKNEKSVLRIETHGNTFGILFQNTEGDQTPVKMIINKNVDIILKDTGSKAPTFKLGNTISFQVFLNDSVKTQLKKFTKLTFDTIPVKTVQFITTSTDSSPFIDSAMLSSISIEGQCQPCEARAIIKQRSDRKFSTNYFIIFDYSHKFDAYTICKHIFRRGGSNDSLIERYKRVSHISFAPPVGSQVSFEVINYRPADKIRILVADSDLFLNSSSFQSVLNTQLSNTILKSVPVTNAALKPDTTKTGDSSKATAQKGGNKEEAAVETDSARLDRLARELSAYAKAFSLSSCTIAANRVNKPVIVARIKKQFQLSSTADLFHQLSDKFKNTTQKTEAEAVGTLLMSLDSLRPLAYSEFRLRNRDYINIKALNEAGETIASTNIRTSLGLKIDFSTGFFLTGLRDFNYIFKDTTLKYRVVDSLPLRDTSGRIIVREKDNKINLGFGFLAHIYPRISSDYNLGLTCGFMSTTNLDLNILLGGSCMFQSLFGANTRIAFNAGIIWGKVSRLSNSAYEGLKVVNNQPVFYPTAINAPPTVKVWDKGFFFGVTYNF